MSRSATGRRLVVEADGGSRGNPGPAGFGAVVRDAESGEVLAEVAEAIGTATNNVAEYRGLIAGLRAAIGVDPRCTVEVRMDSKLVVEQMSGRWSIKHEDMRRLAAQARAVLPPQRVTYTWVPRSQNAYADRLANAAMDAAAAPPASRNQPGTASVGSPLPGDPGAATTLLLVRHGRTVDTEQRRFSGSGGDDPGLSPAGERDVRQLAEALAALGGARSPLPQVPAVSRVVCSPLRRSRDTALLVADALGADLEPVMETGWRELAFGAWEGLTLAEVTRRWPDEVGRWFGATAQAPPGGESLDELAARVRAQRARTVASSRGQVVLVVAHGGPVAAVVQEALDAGPQALWRLRVDPCALTAVRYWDGGAAQVLTVNAGAHLTAASHDGLESWARTKGTQ